MSEGGEGRGRLGIAEEDFTVANALAFINFFVAIFCFSIRPNDYLNVFLKRKKKKIVLIFLFIVNCKNNFKIFIRTF